MSPDLYEKLGLFYLGREVNPDGHPSEAPLLYDSRNLTTHGVCVGMTGSGKTGLCLALLEEAAMDGIPALMIDPKGDLGNLLLTFPNMSGDDFLPWVNEEDAGKAGVSLADFAAAAYLSVIDYFGDVPWRDFPAAKTWYMKLKSRPCFRPLLADRFPGVQASAWYADLDF